MAEIPDPRFKQLGYFVSELIPTWIDRPVTEGGARKLLARLKVQKWKSNPAARRGGGRCFYSVTDFEKAMTRRVVARSRD